MEEVEGSAEEFIKDNIKKKKGGEERQRQGFEGKQGRKKSNLFMIHHIDSPRRLA